MNRKNALGRHLRGRNMYMEYCVSVFEARSFAQEPRAVGRQEERAERLRRKAQEPRKCQRKIPICLEILAAVHGMYLSPLIVLR